jgi:hypothetical protein
MILQLKFSPYIDRFQLYGQICRHQHCRMTIRFSRHTGQSLAGVSAIYMSVARSPLLAEFCELDRQVQYNCCVGAETGFVYLVMVSLKS